MSLTDSELKIGYMPLAHDVYWEFFPQFEAHTIELAQTYRDYLAQFGTIHETGKLIDCPDRSREARQLFQARDVDVLILSTVTYSTPDDVVLDLKTFNRPVIVWNTQASATISPDMDFPMWMYEHGITGVPGITNLLAREKMPYFLVSGHYTSDSVTESFATALNAVAARKHIWGSKIGMLGHLYPGMIDFGYDPTTMFTTFGVATVPVLDSVVLAAFEAVDETEVESLAAEMSERYTIADDFQGQEFTNSIRLAHAVRRLVDENNLAAVTVYCQSMWQRPEIGVVPCLGLSLLMQQGTFCSCEGDVPTALSGLILEQLAGTAVFTEIWCNDFANDQFMMGHSGTMNLGLFEGSEERVQINRHPWWDGCCGRGACLQVKMHPGEVTLLSLTEVPDAGWRMIVTTAQVVDRDPVPLGAPNFFIKLGKPITEFLEDLGELAAAHHFAMAYGNQTQDLQAFAKLLGVEYCEI